MKLVKEHINEKFVEDSDPIHDMNIGGIPIEVYKIRDKYRKRYKDNDLDGRKNWVKKLKKIFAGKKIKGKFKNNEKYIIIDECTNVRSWRFGDRIVFDTTDGKHYDLIKGQIYFIL